MTIRPGQAKGPYVGPAGAGSGSWLEPVITLWDPSTGLPLSPILGDRYLATGTSGGWTGEHIYEWNGVSWTNIVPNEGDVVFVKQLNQMFAFNQGSWRLYPDYWLKPVISIFDNTAATPAGPSLGQRYIALVTAHGWIKDHVYEWDEFSWVGTIQTVGCTTLVMQLGEFYCFSGAGWVALEDYWLDPVISIFNNTVALPVAPTVGDRYIAQVTANGWTANYVYEWSGTSWNPEVPTSGMMCYNNAQALPYLFTGVSWVQFAPLTAHALGGPLHTNATVTELKAKITGPDFLITSQSAEIDSLTLKVLPVAADELVIEDSADTFKKKKITISTLPAAAPAAHASTHDAGGSDAMAIDAVAATGSLRTLGTTATAACAGNDSRLSDARVPVAHATSHAFAGSDPTGVQVAVTNAQHYTGFPNRTDSSLSFVNGTLTFSLTGTFDVYGLSIKYTPTAPQKTIVIPNVTGLYWLWYTFPGGVPTLNQSTSFPGFNQCLVATVYWNAATAVGRLSDERHSSGRDPLMHEYFHDSRGMAYASGLDGAFTNTTFSIGAGEVYDEDNSFNITPAKTVLDVLYMNGSTAWVTDAANVNPYKLNGNAIRYNNGTALADVGTGNYVSYWVFATNSLVNPLVSIMGQRIDTTLANNRLNALPSALSLGQLPSAEMKLLYKVTYHQSGVNVIFDEIVDYRAGTAQTLTGLAVANHASLSNLNYTVAGHIGFFTLASAEISALTAKATPVGADVVLIEDSAATYSKKQVTFANLWANAPAATPAAHAASHLPSGGDSLTTAVAGASAVGDSAAVGAANSLARSDHKHSREAFGSPVASAPADTASDGVATTVARSDHRHARESVANLSMLTRQMLFPADALNNPVNSGWVVNSLSPVNIDPSAIATLVRAFDDTTPEGAGIGNFRIPAGATNIIIEFVGHPNTAVNGKTVQFDVYGKDLGENSAQSAWSSAQAFTNIAINANAYFTTTSTTFTLASLNLVAGRACLLEFVRRSTGGHGAPDTLIGDYYVAMVKISFS